MSNDKFFHYRSKRMQEFENFCDVKGYLPSLSSKDEEEKELAKWFHNLYRNSFGKTNEEIQQWINQIEVKHPGLRTFRRRINMELIEEFCEKHGYRPSVSQSNEYECELGKLYNSLVSRCEDDYRNINEYNEVQNWRKILEEKYQSKLIFERNNDMRLVEEFCKKYGHQPSAKTPQNEEERLISRCLDSLLHRNSSDYKNKKEFEELKNWAASISRQYPTRRFFYAYNHNMNNASVDARNKYFKMYAQKLNISLKSALDLPMIELWQSIYDLRQEAKQTKNDLDIIKL